jgi:hypothetical protein
MKAFQLTSTGFGKQIFLAETVEGAIDEFRADVARCDKLNGQETSSADTVILQVRRIGTVINQKP